MHEDQEANDVAICNEEDGEDPVICGDPIIASLVVDSTFLKSSRAMCSRLQEQLANHTQNVCDPTIQDCDKLNSGSPPPLLLAKHRLQLEGVTCSMDTEISKGAYSLQAWARCLSQPLPRSQEYAPPEPPPRSYSLES